MDLIDAHCHLEKKYYPDLAPYIERARAAGVTRAIVVGQFVAPGDFGTAIETSREYPEYLSPTMGVHPSDAALATPQDWEQLEKLVRLPEVVAVGESGLDSKPSASTLAHQTEGFRRHCQLSRAVNKPVVVHVRDLHRECAAVLREERPTGAMIHCFTGDVDALRGYLDLGCQVSISGVVTYAKTDALKEAVRFAPLDCLMLETDSPYLTPTPNRGRFPNEPAEILHTARQVASLKGLSLEEVATTCAANTRRFFQLPQATSGG